MRVESLSSLPPGSEGEPGVTRWSLAEAPRGGTDPNSDSIGLTLIAPGSTTDTIVHNRPEFATLLDGELLVTVDGTEEPITAGQFLIVPTGSTHSYRNIAREPARMLFVFAGDLAAPRGCLPPKGRSKR